MPISIHYPELNDLDLKNILQADSDFIVFFLVKNNDFESKYAHSTTNVTFVTNIVFSSQAEVEETIKRIQSHKGVIGVIVINADGECTTVRHVKCPNCVNFISTRY